MAKRDGNGADRSTTYERLFPVRTAVGSCDPTTPRKRSQDLIHCHFCETHEGDTLLGRVVMPFSLPFWFSQSQPSTPRNLGPDEDMLYPVSFHK